MTSYTLDRAALSVMHAVHREKTRYSMDSVAIMADGRVLATDGCVLAEVLPADRTSTADRGRIAALIPAKMAKDIAKAVGKGERETPAEVSPGTDVTTIRCGAVAFEVDVAPEMLASYPPTADVIPTIERRPGCIVYGLGLTQLKAALAAAEQFGGPDAVVMMEVPDTDREANRAMTRMIVRETSGGTGGGRELRIVVMPRNLGDSAPKAPESAHYHITARKSGESHGVYRGETPAAALAALHRDAGYTLVSHHGDEMVWPSRTAEELCGGLDAWDVLPVTVR